MYGYLVALYLDIFFRLLWGFYALHLTFFFFCPFLVFFNNFNQLVL